MIGGLIATLFLTGCATVSSRCPDPTFIPADVQTRAADELDALPADSALAAVVEAAFLDREKLRFCRAVEGRS